MRSLTTKRKRDHLQSFRSGSAGLAARGITTWFEHVHLVHSALPELAVSQIDLGATLAGHRLKAPLIVTGMTGGTKEAGTINRALARVAERLGIAFGLGSSRAMIENPALSSSYQVRRDAPGVFLAANLGGVQLVALKPGQIQAMLDTLGADALCVHLNPAQEMTQPEGDRDFRGVLAAIERLVHRLERPIIVKETGAGISRRVGLMLRDAGVKTVDVAGCGGTSWVGVELVRQGLAADTETLAFWDWGIPTAAAVGSLADTDLDLIASGGIRTGLDAAKAIALGARLAGVAAPVIQAYFASGQVGVQRFLEGLIQGIKTAMVLTGCRRLDDLKAAAKVITGPLKEWLECPATGK